MLLAMPFTSCGLLRARLRTRLARPLCEPGTARRAPKPYHRKPARTLPALPRQGRHLAVEDPAALGVPRQAPGDCAAAHPGELPDGDFGRCRSA
jgi:hypothetical protein